MNELFGNASAINKVEKPTPQPMSATFAPASSLGATPSSAGSHACPIALTYPGRKNAPTAQKRQPLLSPNATPSPVRKALSTFGWPLIISAAKIERAFQVDRAVLYREHHCLFRREA